MNDIDDNNLGGRRLQPATSGGWWDAVPNGAGNVLYRTNEFIKTVIVAILHFGSGSHAPIMIPVSHRSHDPKELGVSPPMLREKSRTRVYNFVTDSTAVSRGPMVSVGIWKNRRVVRHGERLDAVHKSFQQTRIRRDRSRTKTEAEGEAGRSQQE